MPIEFKNNKAKLTGLINIEDAESLFNWLIKKKKPKVDLSEVNHIHTAALQILLIFRSTIVNFPENDLKIFFGWRDK
jgi:ABC-type transporter Mla MlaB component